MSTTATLPEHDDVLAGPFWPESVRVLFASRSGTAIRIQAVGVADGKYYDQTLTDEQFAAHVHREVGGTHVFDGSPLLFRLATEALRTHLAHAFDPQYAVSVSQVDPLPHQLDAVYRHMLPLPRIRFLLADDPGAGKTIMAGLLMRELMQRNDVQRVLVLCPKALTDQWRRELWERFRERFTILTGDSVAAMFGQNAWAEHDKVVASVDLAVQDHIRPGIENAEWDLVIFDEAHKLSAYRYGAAGKIDKTQRYQIAEALAKRTKHLLLMTATPHKGDDENFRLLLALLDETVFASLSGARRAIEGDHSPYFLRRMKEAMRHFDGRPLFLPRHVTTAQYPLSPAEQALYDAVTAYVASGLELAERTKNRNVGLALTVLQRRLASSLHAITRSLERRRDRLSDELAATRAGKRTAARETVALPEDPDEAYEELGDEGDDLVSSASNARTAAELEAEVAKLTELIARAHATMRAGPERKLEEFRRVLDTEAVRDRNEKILVFTEHKDTLDHLTGKLREWGFTVCNIHGGMRLQDRIAAEKEFRGPVQVMVATDAAGEGINLQFCRLMVNWDLPWNPNRLEQRMGRIHRYGQEYDVQITNLVASTTREGEVLIRLMGKLDRMREALGHDQVYDVIASILDGGRVRLDSLIREAILNRRSMDDLLAEIEYVDTAAAVAAAKEALGEALATSVIDLAAIDLEQRDSKERRLTPEYVERFFVDALRHLGGRAHAASEATWRIEHVPLETRQRARAKHAGETGAENRLVTFRKERLRLDPPAEFLGPGHPLFDAVVEAILDDGRPALARGAVFRDPQATEPSLVWLLEAAVVNGQGEIVHRRMLGLRQTAAGAYQPVSPGVVLDLAPEEPAPTVPAALRALADPDAAIEAAGNLYAGDYRDEVAREQERRAEIVERAMSQSTADGLARLQAQLERQFADQERGKEMGIAIRNTNAEIERLTAALERRRAELSHSRNVSIATPRVVGVAAVVPDDRPKPKVQLDRSGGDQRAVEHAAMAHAMAFEAAAGRAPADVSAQGVGYDIRSEGPGGEVRYIEVKGHLATGDVTLYYTEWQTAHRMRREFFIYNVDHATTAPRLLIVQDPVGRGVRPLEKVVEYRIPADALRDAAREHA